MAIKVHWDDCLGPRGDLRLDQVQVQVPGDRFGIDRDGDRAVVDHGECRRDVRAGTDENLVALADACGANGKLEGCRPAAYSDAIGTPDIGGELGLELPQRAPEGTRDLAATE